MNRKGLSGCEEKSHQSRDGGAQTQETGAAGVRYSVSLAGSPPLLLRRLVWLLVLILLSCAAGCRLSARNVTLVGAKTTAEQQSAPGQVVESEEPVLEPEQPVPIYVHVSGAVAAPGVYILATGQRACDALAAAGGPSADAVLEAVNLAARLFDAQQLHIPSRTEWERALSGTTSSVGVLPGAPLPAQWARPALLDVNSAGSAALQTLPGIGPVLASRIIAYRNAHGPFAAVDDLINVSGIGPSRLEDIRPFVRVSRAP